MAIWITAIICATVIVLAFIGRNVDDDGGGAEGSE